MPAVSHSAEGGARFERELRDANRGQRVLGRAEARHHEYIAKRFAEEGAEKKGPKMGRRRT